MAVTYTYHSDDHVDGSSFNIPGYTVRLSEDKSLGIWHESLSNNAHVAVFSHPEGGGGVFGSMVAVEPVDLNARVSGACLLTTDTVVLVGNNSATLFGKVWVVTISGTTATIASEADIDTRWNISTPGVWAVSPTRAIAISSQSFDAVVLNFSGTTLSSYEVVTLNRHDNLITGDTAELEVGVGDWEPDNPAVSGLEQSTTEAWVDSGSLKVTQLVNFSDTVARTPQGTSGIPFDPSRPYLLRLWGGKSSATGSDVQQLFMDFYDSGGTLLATQGGSGTARRTMTSLQDWIQFELGNTSPVSTAFISVRLRKEHVGLNSFVYFDHVSLRYTDEGTMGQVVSAITIATNRLLVVYWGQGTENGNIYATTIDVGVDSVTVYEPLLVDTPGGGQTAAVNRNDIALLDSGQYHVTVGVTSLTWHQYVLTISGTSVTSATEDPLTRAITTGGGDIPLIIDGQFITAIGDQESVTDQYDIMQIYELDPDTGHITGTDLDPGEDELQNQRGEAGTHTSFVGDRRVVVMGKGATDPAGAWSGLMKAVEFQINGLPAAPDIGDWILDLAI